ncbi:MAG TPA: hypothetical protein VKC56_02615 [Gallionellaceae bacterium]|nr:hypothetical protein [Gallionellaceae bacterium]
MSIAEPDEERIRRNIQRTLGQHALRALRAQIDEELRADAANARFVRAFVKYGIITLLAALIALAYLPGVF